MFFQIKPLVKKINQSQRIKNAEKKFKCDLCKKEYVTEGGLNRHKDAFHLHPDRYQCQYCDQKFGVLYLKERHENQFICRRVLVRKSSSESSL